MGQVAAPDARDFRVAEGNVAPANNYRQAVPVANPLEEHVGDLIGDAMVANIQDYHYQHLEDNEEQIAEGNLQMDGGRF